jgi:hypothetical protein
MRFPALLSLKLARARVAGFFRGAPRTPLIDFLDAAEVLHAGSAHPISHERMRGIFASPAPVLWIGGSEPLEHPGIAHLVRAVVQSGRFVFLETCGTLLRRRIHEFQPVPRLFLAVRSDLASASADPRVRKPDPFELALEGIRAAKLSGFLVCMCAGIRADMRLKDVADLVGFADSLDLDGLVVTPAADSPQPSIHTGEALRQKTLEAREQIGSRWWQSFSELVEVALRHKSQTEHRAHASAEDLEHESDAGEESVRIA